MLRNPPPGGPVLYASEISSYIRLLAKADSGQLNKGTTVRIRLPQQATFQTLPSVS